MLEGFSSRRFVSEFTGGQLDPTKLGPTKPQLDDVTLRLTCWPGIISCEYTGHPPQCQVFFQDITGLVKGLLTTCLSLNYLLGAMALGGCP